VAFGHYRPLRRAGCPGLVVKDAEHAKRPPDRHFASTFSHRAPRLSHCSPRPVPALWPCPVRPTDRVRQGLSRSWSSDTRCVFPNGSYTHVSGIGRQIERSSMLAAVCCLNFGGGPSWSPPDILLRSHREAAKHGCRRWRTQQGLGRMPVSDEQVDRTVRPGREADGGDVRASRASSESLVSASQRVRSDGHCGEIVPGQCRESGPPGRSPWLPRHTAWWERTSSPWVRCR
jgi:hypothetical protein